MQVRLFIKTLVFWCLVSDPPPFCIMAKHQDSGKTAGTGEHKNLIATLTNEQLTALWEIFEYGSASHYLNTAMQVCLDSMQNGMIDSSAHADFLFHTQLLFNFIASVEDSEVINPCV